VTVTLLQGDCREVLRTLDADSFDSCVTDPPYHLTTGKKGGTGEASVNLESPYGRARVTTGFMGMTWDGGDVAFQPETWAEVLRVLKPGAFLLAFGGTRTYHRLACAIEDAGFEIRDQVGWLYGSGFPKSHNGPWGGTALKPAWEPICMARKPLIGTVEANWREHGTGALNIDACRVGWSDDTPPEIGTPAWGGPAKKSTAVPGQDGETVERAPPSPLGRWPANVLHDGSDEVIAAFPASAGQIADASSSSSSSRKTQNVYGAMRRGNGRDGEPSAASANEGAVGFNMKPGARRGDTGSAARFFWSSKASRADRNDGLHGMDARPQDPSRKQGNPGGDNPRNRGVHPRANHHPTVKPTDLMRYLCRLVTPPGGQVLDPFMGSGSTLKGAELEGFGGVGIELDPEYIAIARRRIAADAPLFAEVTQ
jgi:site-specific DNA-methyltransferase (adenine-specific)